MTREHTTTHYKVKKGQALMNAIRLIEKFIDERITEVLPILEKESVIYQKRS